MFSRTARRVASVARRSVRAVRSNARPLASRVASRGVRTIVSKAPRTVRVAAKPKMAWRKWAAGAAVVGGAVATMALENKVVQAAEIPTGGVPGTNNERTFIAIKPDGVERGLIGKIIERFERKGFKLVGMKFLTPSEKDARGHYDDLKKKPFFGSLVSYFASGPIVAMVWEGKGVIKTGRVLLGATNPADSAPGTIRGDLCVDIGRNIIHGSDSPEAAQHEITFWFRAHEVSDWTPSNAKWVYEKP
uniref:Nucleoside diphosphate kinase n=1 Tax=Coccolithus braarudii TaxID=221442 RepID=A0A7S0LB23_9EUKA|eukprot:CAMPEP_0183348144 /NCGR_PEP_ID=MMETSP0164_2-20130417/12755_1 /TAXON_ID=221442 /ORGANISM="Coccolithus pelagicus ssp braarudi, Strain PLY182g" /LENGTH=246 /DNA_ID=CAMNT_0025519697 /DNA_START=24 /DNA_END=764 /DNA_ORIENTATION=+